MITATTLLSCDINVIWITINLINNNNNNNNKDCPKVITMATVSTHLSGGAEAYSSQVTSHGGGGGRDKEEPVSSN